MAMSNYAKMQAMKRRIYSFVDFVPSVLYWDASFIVNFAYPAAKYHLEAANFLSQLDDAHAVSYISTLTLDEVYFVLLQAKVSEAYPQVSFWRVYRANPAIIVPYLDELERLTEELYAHPRIRVVTANPILSFSALSNMRRYHLLPRDAYHLAIMRQNGIVHIATMNSDFLSVPDLIIHTCVPSILAQAKR